VLPNERARAASAQEKPGLVRGGLLEVLEPAAERVAARPYSAAAAAALQHAPYEFSWRRSGDPGGGTERLGKIEPRRRSRRCPRALGVPQSGRSCTSPMAAWAIGSPVPQTLRLDQCPISSPKLNEVIAKLTVMLRDPRWPRFVKSVEVFTTSSRFS